MSTESIESIRERLRSADKKKKKAESRAIARRREIEWNRNKRIRLREIIAKNKSGGCSSCGEKHIACLDWHHIDQKTKEVPLSKALSMGFKRAVEFLEEESSKCVVLCANCHRKLHYENGTRGMKFRGKHLTQGV